MKLEPKSRNQLRTKLLQDIDNGQIEPPAALKILRQVLGKSQSDYAKLVGVSKKIISDFELGRGNPTVETMNKMFAPIGLEVGLARKRR